MPGPARLASLAFGGSVALLLMVFPFVLGHQITTVDRIGLCALLLGVSGAFVHGFGYAPERPAWRLLFSPAAAWSLMLAGGLCLLL